MILMNTTWLLVGFAGGVVILLGSLFVLKEVVKTEKPDLPAAVEKVKKPIEKKAYFLIFTNGTRRIFDDPKYHNQSEEIYLEAQAPNKLIVKKEGAKWKDLFATLPMELSKDCLMTGTGQRFCTGETGFLAFYVNGEKIDDMLEREINDGDKLLVSFGSQNEEEIKNQQSQLEE